MRNVLVVDDEASLRDVLGIALRKQGYTVQTASSRESAAKALMAGPVDLVLTDVRLPDGDGIEILRHVKSASPDTVVIVMTAFGSTENAVAALKLGAYDYLIKPFDIDELQIVVGNAFERQELKSQVLTLRDQLKARADFQRVIGSSAVMARVIEIARAVASTSSTVLLTGESGTGKEVLAKAIHLASPRREKPFVSINCGALPESLLESELFGHVKGAFTDAHQNKKGLFEAAHLGTIFLDEVGEMPFAMQVKLLRVLQERTIRRVGDQVEIPVDVRVIAATNRSLEKMVRDGTFRSDLYYRLNVIPLPIPPLRERKEDIPLLVDHFLRLLAGRMEKTAPLLAPSELGTLRRHDWPGNVRELENLLERALALEVSPAALLNDAGPARASPLEASLEPAIAEGFSLDAYLAAEEARLLRRALEQSGGDRAAAARLLGVNARGLRYLISKHPETEGS